MRRGRIFILILLFLVLGVLCGLLYLRMRVAAPAVPAGATPTLPVPMVQVVVTARDIPRGHRITEEDLTTVQVPQGSAVETQILDPNEAVGKLAARDLPRGVFLTKGDLVESVAELSRGGSVAALNIPPGYVAISIPITRLSSVAYALRPGDKVGILVTLAMVDLDPDFQTRLPNLSAALNQVQGQEGPASPVYQVVPSSGPIGKPIAQEYPLYAIPSETSRPRLVSQMIISDAVVLYVGTFPWQVQEAQPQLQATPQPVQQPVPPGQPAQPAATPTPPDVVTLIVRPQDAVTLKYLMDRQVYFTLVLRSADDTQPISTDPVTLNYLLEQYNLVVPSKQTVDLEPRIDQVLPPDLPTPQP